MEEVTTTAGLDGFGLAPRMLERQRLGTIRTNDPPWRDKRANDSAAQRLTHMRWDRTAAEMREGLARKARPELGTIWPPEWPPRLFEVFELVL